MSREDSVASGITDCCSVCKNKVMQDDLAVDCGDSAEESVHWTHAACLEKTHLLNSAIVVPLSQALFDKIEGLQFSYFCHSCSQGKEPPLPFQLVTQGILTLQDFASLDILTPELENYLRTKNPQNRVTKSQ